MQHGNPLLLTNGQVAFNRYRLKMLVGKGATGVVWRAHDQELELDIALKFLAEDFLYDAGALGDLKRETRRGMALSHPAIVRIFGFFQDAGHAAIAMEYVEGNTVSGLQASRSEPFFEVAEISDWVTQLCGALDYAHNDAQIVHRDLKPGNLLLDDRGRLKIADFGIAAGINDAHTRVIGSAEARGTLAYMSPQQLLGQAACVSHDIYSLGATLYELLTGRPPFFTGDISLQVRTIVPPTVSERRREFGITGLPIPAEWESTLASCLAKDASQRPSSVAEVAQRLGLGLSSGATITPRRKTPTLPPAPAAPTAVSSSQPTVAVPLAPVTTNTSPAVPPTSSPAGAYPAETPPPASEGKRNPVFWLAIGAGAAVVLAGAGVLAAYLTLNYKNAPVVAEQTPAQPPVVAKAEPKPVPPPAVEEDRAAAAPAETAPAEEPPRPINRPVRPEGLPLPTGPGGREGEPRDPMMRGQGARKGPQQPQATPALHRERTETPRPEYPFAIPDLNMAFAWIPPGGCRIGAPPHGEELPENEKPTSELMLTRGFWMGTLEVSRKEYATIMGSIPRGQGAGTDDFPVTNLTWLEAAAFCEKLNAREVAAGRVPEGYIYALPPEFFWEYALKNGTDGPSAPYNTHQGATWGRFAGVTGPQLRGQLRATPWGLHDMYGNVAEWVADWYAPHHPGRQVVDFRGPPRGTQRAYRGGYYGSDERDLRPSTRWGLSPSQRSPHIGFRVALVPKN